MGCSIMGYRSPPIMTLLYKEHTLSHTRPPYFKKLHLCHHLSKDGIRRNNGFLRVSEFSNPRRQLVMTLSD